MAVRRGLYVQPTAGGVGTTPTDARINQAGLLTPSGALGVAPGVLSGLTVTGVASGWTYQVTAGHAVTSRGATDGAVLLSVDGNTNTPAPVLANGSAGSTSAPVSGSRYELIWILQRDLDAAEADNIAALGVTQGTASGSPTRPTVPTGALVLAEALVPSGAANTAAGTVTITSVGAKVGLRGATVAVANATQRDLLNSYATATTPVIVDRLDLGHLQRSVASGTWTTMTERYVLQNSASGAAAPSDAVPLIQAFVIEATTDGSGVININFPETFAFPPIVQATTVSGTAVAAIIASNIVSTTGCRLNWPGVASTLVRAHVTAIGWRP